MSSIRHDGSMSELSSRACAVGTRPVAAALLAVLAGLAPLRIDAQELTGTFRGGSAGELVLALQVEEGRYVGRLTTDGRTIFEVEGTRYEDEDGEVGVEGEVLGGGVADFELGWDPEDASYSLFLTPYQGGVPRMDLAALSLLERVSAEAEIAAFVDQATPSAPSSASAPGPAPPASTAEGVDPRLVGVWATQVMMSTPGGTVATRISMELQADGTMIDLGSRAMGSFPGTGLDDRGPTGDRGRWRVEDGVLLVSYQGSQWVPMARYTLRGASLMLTFGDGSTQLWERAR